MSIQIRGNGDQVLEQIGLALDRYQKAHPNSNIDIYRQNSVAIRVRIVDPDFSGMNRADRHESVWREFESLPDEIQSDLSLLLLLTPEEKATSFANLEFENPTVSCL